MNISQYAHTVPSGGPSQLWLSLYILVFVCNSVMEQNGKNVFLLKIKIQVMLTKEKCCYSG